MKDPFTWKQAVGLWLMILAIFTLIVLAGKLVAMSWGEWTERGRERARRREARLRPGLGRSEAARKEMRIDPNTHRRFLDAWRRQPSEIPLGRKGSVS